MNLCVGTAIFMQETTNQYTNYKNFDRVIGLYYK